MKKKKDILKLFLLFLVLFSALPAIEAAAEKQDTVLREKRSVVTIFINTKSGEHVTSGSGFVADEDGVIATSCRLLSKWLERVEYSLSVELEGGRLYPVDYVISNNCKNNLAMIKIKAAGLPAVKLATSREARTGERIVMLSGSSAAGWGAEAGVIKSVRERDGIFQLGIGVTKERDGSPIFNPRGEVVGIVTIPDRGKPQHIVIPARYVMRELIKCRNLIKEIPETASVPVNVAPSAPAPSITQPDKSAKLQETKSAEQEFLKASSFEKSGMYKEAVEAYRQALGLKPDYIDAYVGLGLAYYKLGRYHEAVDAYQQALRFKPDTPSIYNKLAAAYIIIGEYPSALKAFKESIKIDPANYETHFNLGVTYLIAGDKDGAINEYFILKDRDAARAEKLLDLIF